MHSQDGSNATPIDRGVPSFDDLLPYDPHEVQKLNSSRRGRGSQVTYLSNSLGLSGSDRHLVLDEVRRVRQATARDRRKREVVWAGIFTTIILAICTYFSLAAAISLAQLQASTDATRTTLAVFQLSTYLPSSCLLVALLVWLHYVRRPSIAAHAAFATGLIIALLLFALSVVNLALVVSQTDESSTRCGVGIDLIWTLYSSGESCYDPLLIASVRGWIIAASLRLLVITLLVVGWLWTLLRVGRALRAMLIVDPSCGPGAEVQAILARRGVSLVSFDGLEKAAMEEESQLPSMPERRQMEPQIETAKKGWFWETVDWLLGRTPPTTGDQDVEEVYVDNRSPSPIPRLIKQEWTNQPTPTYRHLFDQTEP